MSRRTLRCRTLDLLQERLHQENFDLALRLVGATEMARINETFLRHKGSTDVITFDYAETPASLHGEIFICLDDARAHARRFRATWQKEVARYVIHGVLHLLGHDDQRPAARRRMKREENRLLHLLDRDLSVAKLLSRLKP